MTCETDSDSGGDITAVAAGAGLTGGGSTGAVTITVDSTAVQNRVTGACTDGKAVSAVNQDGTVNCFDTKPRFDSADAKIATLNNTLIMLSSDHSALDTKVAAQAAEAVQANATLSQLLRTLNDVSSRLATLENVTTRLQTAVTTAISSVAPPAALADFIVTGVAAYLDVGGAQQGGSMALVPATYSVGGSLNSSCSDAVGSALTVATGGRVKLAAGLTAGKYALCYATLGAARNNDFWLQSLAELTVVAPVITAIAPVNAATTTVAFGATVKLQVTGAANGDRVGLLFNTAVGCTGASLSGASAVVTDGAVDITIPISSGATTLKVCHAAAARVASAFTDNAFAEQAVTLQATSPVVTGLSPRHASSIITAGVSVWLAATGSTASGDFVALLPSSTAGCLGSSVARKALFLGNEMFCQSTLSAGSYKVCYAPAGSSGDQDNDYIEQTLQLTVSAATVTQVVPINALAGAVSPGVAATLSLTGSISENDFISLVAVGAVGCKDAQTSRLTVSASKSVLLTSGSLSQTGTFHACVAASSTGGDAEEDFVRQPATIEVSNALTGASITGASASTIAAGANVTASISGTYSTGDFLSLILASTVGCQGAESTRNAIESSGAWTIYAPSTTGQYKVCQALAATGGQNAANFRELPISFAVVAQGVQSVLPVSALQHYVAAGASTICAVAGAADGDFVALVPTSSSACSTAVTNRLNVATGRITTPANLAAGSYRTCHAASATNGDEASDYIEQAFVLVVASATVTSIGAVSALPQPVTSGVATAVQLGGPSVVDGDFVALIASSAVGCTDSHTVKLTLASGGRVTVAAGTAAGTWKVCYALQASTGDAAADFVDQGVQLVVASKAVTSLTPVNAAASSFTAATVVTLSVVGTVSTGNYVSLVPTSTEGCTGASLRNMAVSSGPVVTTSTLFTVGTYKACLSTGAGNNDALYSDQGGTYEVVSAGVSAIATVNAVPGSIAANTAMTLSVTDAATGDFVSLVSSSSVGCVGASSSKATVSGSSQIVTSASISAGQYRVCHAAASTSGSTDASFRAQPIELQADGAITTVRVAGTTDKTIVGQGTATIIVLSGSLSNHDFVTFLPSATIGCQGSAALKQTVSGSSVSTPTSLALGAYKICFAAASSSGNEDADFVDYGTRIQIVEGVSLHPVEAYLSSIVTNVASTMQVSGAADGDFVALVPTSSSACSTAVTNRLNVATGRITTPANLAAGSYRTCHAASATNGDEASDYIEQAFVLVVASATVTSIGAVSALPQPVTSGVATAVQLGGPSVVDGDFVALIASSAVGCTDSHTVKLTLASGGRVTVAAGTAAGTWKVCYALQASTGDAAADFVDQGVQLVVASKAVTSLTPVNAAASSFTAATVVTLSVVGTVSTGNYVSLVPTSTEGCTGASLRNMAVSSGPVVTTSTLFTVGTYKACLSTGAGNNDALYSDQGGTYEVVSAGVSAIATVNAVPGSIAANTAMTLSVTDAATGDFVSLVSSSSVGCVGASSSKATVSGSSQIVTSASISAGQYRVCHAAASTSGSTDASFRAQPPSFTVDSPMLAVHATLSSSGAVVHTNLRGATGVHVSVLSGTIVGCLGAVSSTVKFEIPAAGDTTRDFAPPTGVSYKICAAAAGSAPTADSSYQQQGPENAISSAGASTRLVVTSQGITQPTGITAGLGGASGTTPTLYVTDYPLGKVFQVNSATGTKSEWWSGLTSPYGVAQDASSKDVYVAETTTGKIRKKAWTSGTVTDFAINLLSPIELAHSSTTGLLYVTCGGASGSVQTINPAGTKTTILTGLSHPYGIALHETSSHKHLYIALGGTKQVVRYTLGSTGTTVSGSASTVVSAGLLQYPHGVVFDSTSNGVFVTDLILNGVFRQAPVTTDSPGGGTLEAYASGILTPRGFAIDSSGKKFVASGLYHDSVQQSPGLVTGIQEL